MQGMSYLSRQTKNSAANKVEYILLLNWVMLNLVLGRCWPIKTVWKLIKPSHRSHALARSHRDAKVTHKSVYFFIVAKLLQHTCITSKILFKLFRSHYSIHIHDGIRPVRPGDSTFDIDAYTHSHHTRTHTHKHTHRSKYVGHTRP